MENKKIMVQRGTYISKKDESERFSYFVKGSLRGKDFKVRITPPDFGGYTVLEIVFGEQNEAELIVKPWEIKDERGRVTSSGNTYGVKSVDGDGKIYECKIKPYQDSDRSLLEMLLSLR